MPASLPPMREDAWLFLKLGTIAFGGPPAHIAMMREEGVRPRRWRSDEPFLDFVRVPGPTSPRSRGSPRPVNPPPPRRRLGLWPGHRGAGLRDGDVPGPRLGWRPGPSAPNARVPPAYVRLRPAEPPARPEDPRLT